MADPISKSELFATLPPPWPENLRPQIRLMLAAQPGHKLIVLDDDPTGTQTVYDVPVLTVWDVETLRGEFAQPGPCFYILINSRSLTSDVAATLNREIARNLKTAAGATRFIVVSRSDSTLRGHFPLETDVLTAELGPFDATILIPYFEAGGRYTIGDVHYVAEGDNLVPAAETPFARDAAFGYRSSNLREWVEEKTGGRVKAEAVVSVTIDDLRRGGPDAVTKRLAALSNAGVCIVNAAAPSDLDVFSVGLFEAERAGARFLFRTAAQIVAARLGLEPRELWKADSRRLPQDASGGLTIVGSYVPKTTEQLGKLLEHSTNDRVELDVETLLDASRRKSVLSAALAQAHAALAAGRDVVVFTSRKLVTDSDAARSLDIGRQVSNALVALVQRLEVRPRYLIAKGGITSSDLATRGLGVRRAMVMGQLLPGIPVWRLGDETKFPGLDYVVFPGNVGRPHALAEAVNKLKL